MNATRPTPFDVADLFLHRRISDVDCTPHGELAVCAVRAIDRERNDARSHLWIVALDGSRTTQLTQGDALDESPTWSPDGRRIAFLSDRGGGSPQVHVIDVDGGEARPVGSFPQAVSSLRWSPDGRALFVTSAVVVDPELRGRASRDVPPPRTSASPEIAWRLPYKSDGVGYLLQRQFHLFRVDVEDGEHAQLTDGAFDVLGFDVAPDGRRLAYSRYREGRFAHRSDLWVCDADGANARRMTDSHATVMQPVWSPDGRRIAFSGAEDEGDAESRVWVADATTGEIRLVGDDALDIADPSSLRWDDDGRLSFVRAHRGRHQVVAIGLGDREPTILCGGDRQFGAYGRTDRRLAYRVDHPALASELWTCDADGTSERKLTGFNDWWNERTPLAATLRTFDVPDGRGGTETIEGWLLHAADGRGPRPLLNEVHGGPASYAPLDSESRIYRQVLCSRGWSVLMLNAVGSASYGPEFCRRLLGRWGEADLPQHLAAIERLRADGVCDERLAITGGSYGGFFSAWTIGHTDLFRAAVVLAPVGNLETHYGTSDGGYYADPYYLESEPRFDRELARRLSPLQHIEKARTPTLFLQGKDDERCPKCQSEELFVTLMRAGDTPTELVLYPGEGHGFTGSGAPACRVDAARRIVEWVERFAVEGDADDRSTTDEPSIRPARVVEAA